jgi:hypothetical protein
LRYAEQSAGVVAEDGFDVGVAQSLERHGRDGPNCRRIARSAGDSPSPPTPPTPPTPRVAGSANPRE